MIIILSTSSTSKFEFLRHFRRKKNYLFWVLNAKIYLNIKGNRDTIIEENKIFNRQKAKTNLHEDLKNEYDNKGWSTSPLEQFERKIWA